MGLSKTLLTAIHFIRGRPADLRKFFEPTVARGKTVWPKTPADLLRFGVRWDYDGVITKSDGKEYHKYQLQPNAGKIPSSIKEWRDKNGGTHAVMAIMYIPKDVTVDGQLFEDEAIKAIKEI
ncbi:hypothetical protein MauCBS54593_005467 [Microsporum audouinii]